MLDFILIGASLLAIAGWWILMPLRAVWHDRALGTLSAVPCDEPEHWPKVSVLVPARNEEAALAAALQSLLELDYPQLEIVVIDDRSTDATAEIADRLARQDKRVRALHIETLPAGWMGKVHAMHRGIAASRGEWLLFTDADIHFSPRVLKRAVAYCLSRERGFLTLFPGFKKTGLLIGATQTFLGVMFLAVMDFARIARADSPTAMGIGAFNLARRSYIDNGDGLEWLRMEVADDAGLALMAKRRGARLDVLTGQDLIKVDWYPTLAGILDGVIQRFALGANYSLWLYALQCVGIVFCAAAPLVASLRLAPLTPLAWLCLGAYALPSLILAAGVRNFALPRGPLAALPLGQAVVAWGMLRSVFTFVRRGGLYWRGRIYPLRELRAAQRVRLSTFF